MTRGLIVNIFSVSYSGSTWVNLLLGSHPRVFSVGELTSIRRKGKPRCRLHGEECPVWGRFDPDPTVNLVERIARASDRRVLIVNNPRQFQRELDRSGWDQKFIHLIRDGRAVMASSLRKYPNQSALSAALHWVRATRKHRKRLHGRPENDSIQVRYEDLCADTGGELSRLCEFLGLDYDPAMQEYWRHDHHFLGGSRGTLFALAKLRGQEPPRAKPNERDLGFYEKSDPQEFVDDRWKSELTPWQLRVFGWVAGRMNRRYGYDARLAS